MTDQSDVEVRPAAVTSRPDLDAIEADLAAVEAALVRLDTGEYWRDEVTGAELSDELLARQPTTRRAPITDTTG
jgi:hypothetical protein